MAQRTHAHARSRTRRIGNSFGVILPVELLRSLRIVEGDMLEVSAEGRRIILKPVRAG